MTIETKCGIIVVLDDSEVSGRRRRYAADAPIGRPGGRGSITAMRCSPDGSEVRLVRAVGGMDVARGRGTRITPNSLRAATW